MIDKLFGTAYLPKDRRPTGFGTHDPVPQDGWLRHLAYPFTAPPARPKLRARRASPERAPAGRTRSR